MEDPPPFLGKVRGFLLIPEHVDLEVVKKCAKKGKKKAKKAKVKRWFKR